MASNPLRDKGFVPGDMSQENYDKIDLHRPYVDDIKLVSDKGNVLIRELDLIDVWFPVAALRGSVMAIFTKELCEITDFQSN